MAHSPLTVNNSFSAGTSSKSDTNQAFRDADFMKILLAEVTQQDPFEPQDTGKIVEGMQKLQELANTRYEKFRDDQRWARDLIGQPVSVQQVALNEKEVSALREKGLDPDVGYLTQSAVVESYRTVNETVWVRAGGKDYPVDSVLQVHPPAVDGSQLGNMSAGLLGRIVKYPDESGKLTEGLVSALGYGADGKTVELTIADKQVPVSAISSIRY